MDSTQHGLAQSPSIRQVFPSLTWMWHLRDAEIEPELRALGYSMMSFADEKGELFPTVAQLALMTPAAEGETVSESTIKRRRARLVALGWIALVSKSRGRGRASVYRLTFPAAENPVSGDARKRVTAVGKKRVTPPLGKRVRRDPPSETSSEALPSRGRENVDVGDELHSPPPGTGSESWLGEYPAALSTPDEQPW